MKRYLLSILLGTFILAAVGTYYVHGALVELPQYKLETIEGDPSEIANVDFSGNYWGGKGSKALMVSEQGTQYEIDKSLFEENVTDARSWMFRQPEFRKLKEQHPHFIRGKNKMESFYKDEEWLIYAEILQKKEASQRITFKIDMVNEKTGKVTRHRTNVDVEVEDAYRFFYVEDVQRIGNELHVFARQNSEFHVYVFDLSSGELLRNETISLNIPLAEGEELSLEFTANEIRSGSGEYVVLRARKQKAFQGQDSSRLEVRGESYYSYSYASGQLVELPKMLDEGTPGKNEFGDFLRLNGQVLTVLKNDTNAITWMRYNLRTGQVEKQKTVVTAEDLGVEVITSITLSQERIFAMLRHEDTAMVAVLDAKSGNILYKGKTVFVGPSSKAEEQLKNLRLLNIEVGV
ncbi:hypothetical protein [Cohnella lupini]|uniref:Uncharacterized protein n=1 Tax=Cohnella lupini TaxID=1294267 RepID=A0A3D9IWX2_9BACL|nr:hypothetical protein [Cohnella lupini]RED66308.1 hypothetical protein DFP95_101807 [Cohnella lupini]